MTYNKEEVKEIEQTLGGKPKWFIGKMVCSKCSNEVLVRYDVYLKRLLKAKEDDISEEEMNKTYECSKCRFGRSVKKEAFYKMLKGDVSKKAK